MLLEKQIVCPYCGEMIVVDIDPTGGARQHYIQDCPVCCRPITILATSGLDGDYQIETRSEDET